MGKEEIKIKRDKYFRKRGSYARIIKVKCAKCNKILFSYQKERTAVDFSGRKCYRGSNERLHSEN